jgi:hypothetical protein
MIHRLALLIALASFTLGCPKRTPSTVSGSDDEQLDQYAAKVDELKSRTQEAEPSCPDWCSMAKTVCDLSRRTCDIATRHSDRQDMQKRCIGSQEDCATFNDRCASCSH